MKFRAVVVVFASATAVVRCVGGDDASNLDGGGDATQSDVAQQQDGTTLKDAASGDGDAGLGPPPTPDGSVVWLNRYNSNHALNDIVVNESGGLTYISVGGFQTDPNAGNKFHFGSVDLGPANNVDVASATIASAGTTVLATSLATVGVTSDASSANVDVYTAVAVDAAGNIYAFGSSTSQSITVKDTLLGITSFIVKLSPSGTPQWEHPYSIPSTTISGPVSLAVSGSTLVVAMTYNGVLTYDTSKTFTSNNGTTDAFVSAIDTSTGNTKWASSFGSSGFDAVNAVTMTPQGDAIVVGDMVGTMTGLTGPGFPVNLIGDAGTGTNLYVIKIDGSGNSVYALTYGDPSSFASAAGVAYLNGTVAVAGSVAGNVDFGKGTVVAPTTDGVLFTFDETTKLTNFVSHLSGTAADAFTSVAIDPWGEVVAAGSYGLFDGTGQLDTKALPQTTIAVAGMVLAKWNAGGTLLWSNAYVPTLNGGGAPYSTADAGNAPQTIAPLRVQTTSTGQIVLTGAINGGTDFGFGFHAPVSTLATPFKCGGVFNCGSLGTCKFCPGVPTDGIIGTWLP